jgi:hypothetical protein
MDVVGELLDGLFRSIGILPEGIPATTSAAG